MRRVPLVALAVLLVVAVGAFARSFRERAIRKTTVDVLPSGFRDGTLAISDDGTAHAYVVTEPAGERVVGSAGIGDLHAASLKPAFAPHTTRLFSWVADATIGHALLTLVADGHPVTTDLKAPGVLVHSADGARWAAVGFLRGVSESESGDIVIIVDGRESVRGADLSLPSFSPDGAHLAYVTRSANGTALVVDGIERRVFEAPASPCARESAESARHPDLLGRHVVRYLADGSLLVATRDADGWGVYRDDTRIASYARAAVDPQVDACAGGSVFIPMSMRFAEGAPASAWWERLAGDEERWRVVRNGVPIDDVVCERPWTSQPPEISRNGKHVAYACKTTVGDDQLVYVVRDGVRHGPYAEIWGFALSDGEGAHVAYGAVDPARAFDSRPWSLYVDGRARGPGWQAVWRPRLGKDGLTLAWEARTREDARGILGVNDVGIMQFQDVVWGPIFERDDREVAWIVRRGRRLIRLGADVAELRKRARR